jgi:protein-tyrosine phosphatase
MAEFVMKNLVKKAGLEKEFFIASAATSTEEIGNPVYPPARRRLAQAGISCDGKHAVQLTKKDYEKYDYIIGMEQVNIRNIMRIVGDDPQKKVYRLLDFTGQPGDIADPWYSGDFDTTYEQVLAGCEGLLKELREFIK